MRIIVARSDHACNRLLVGMFIRYNVWFLCVCLCVHVCLCVCVYVNMFDVMTHVHSLPRVKCKANRAHTRLSLTK